MMTNADEGHILANSGLFSGVPEQQLRQLAFASDRYVFTDGAFIVRQGDHPDMGFLVLDGEARITFQRDGAEVELMALGKGDLLGAKALVSGGGYRATARAKGTVEVLCIQRDDFLTLLESDKAAMAGVLEYLAKQQAQAEEALGITPE